MVGLRITDKTTTIDLTTGDFVLTDYQPRAPRPMSTSLRRTHDNGADTFGITYDNVDEVTEFVIIDHIEENVHRINRLIQNLVVYKNSGAGRPVFAQFRLNEDSDWYESELQTAELQVRDNFLSYQYPNGQAECTLAFKRDYCWQHVEWQNVELTGGGTVYNANDETHRSYVDVDGSQIDGDLPAPLELRVQNNSPYALTRVDIGLNWLSSPAVFPHHYELEDVAQFSSNANVSVQDNNAYSGGKYVTYAWSDNTASFSVDILKTTLDMCAGSKFRVLVYMEPSADALARQTKFRLILLSSTNVTIYEGNWQYLDNANLQNFGTITLPPRLNGRTNLEKITLTIQAQNGGGDSLALDYLQLFPVDGWLRLEGDMSTGWTGTAVIDTTDNSAWVETANAETQLGVVGFGNMRLMPNVHQRLYVQTQTVSVYDQHGDVLMPSFPYSEAVVTVRYKARKLII